MVDRVSASVVRITGVEKSEDGEPGRDMVCTGEVIGHNRVLTAGHCVGLRMLADGEKAVVLKTDDLYDLALLGTETHKKPAIVFRDINVSRFEQLTAIGYAWGINKLTVLDVRAFLVDLAPTKRMAPGIIVQGGYVGGMSGGPVVDQKGQQVGIVQQSNDGVGYGVGIQIIRVFLLGEDE